MPAREFDPIQALAAGLLAGLGLITLYSASPLDFRRQVLFVLLGVAVYVVGARFDYRLLKSLAAPAYAAGVVALAAVAVLGHTRLGAQRWIDVAGVPVEPSEMDKLVMIVVLAALLSPARRWTWRRLGGVLAVAALPAGLVMLQPDLGTAIVFAALLVGLLFLAGVPGLQLAAVAGAGLLLLPLIPHLLHGYQRQRLLIFLDPSRDPLGAGYNLIQARIAVGSGGLWGRGWGQGGGQLGYVPARTTDFVFALFAQQFGLIGSLVLLFVFGILIYRLGRSAAMAPDRFGRLICLGLALVLAVQVIQNVGMNLGLTPIAGIPLPFISSGGSSLVTLSAGLGLAQSTLRQRGSLAHRAPLASLTHVPAPGGTVHLGL
ncbi:MAG TPA: FtsW/RodA/SpoVE family cell cycle protein [Candidatus Nitrosotalea sp.]|nr:FtsW/RodA/SpoVE family cell cycle protein [Candidatus Nitrosotalea sp.]